MNNSRHTVNRVTTRGCLVPVVIGAVAIFFISTMLGGFSLNRYIQQEELKQKQIETRDLQHAADEAQKRREAWTAFYKTAAGNLESFTVVLFWGGGGVVVVFFLWNGLKMNHARMKTDNQRRYISAGNNLLIDTITGETLDLLTGAVIPNEATFAKLMIHGQTERIRALGETGQRFNASMGKTAIQAWQPKELAPVAPVAKDEPLQLDYDIVIPTIADAVKQSSPNAWIMGADNDGALALHIPGTDPHLAICGSTGSRKTSNAAMLSVVYARKFGYHVIILDGKGGVDWGKTILSGMYEHHVLTSENIELFVDQLIVIYKERAEIIRDADVSHIDDLNNLDYPPLFVVFEELSQPFYDLSKEDATRVQMKIGKLMGVCRFTGIMLELIDQRPNEAWNKAMKGNIGSLLCYKLKMHQGKAVAVEKADQLLPGQFNHNGTVYEGWFAERDYPIQRNLPKQGGKPVLSAVVGGLVPSSEWLTGSATTSQPLSQPVQPPITSSATTSQPPTTTSQPPVIEWDRYSKMRGEKLKAALIAELPKLDGEPVDDSEVQYVLDAYINLPSKNMVYFAAWGVKDGRRAEWLQDVIDDDPIQGELL